MIQVYLRSSYGDLGIIIESGDEDINKLFSGETLQRFHTSRDVHRFITFCRIDNGTILYKMITENYPEYFI